MVFRVLVRDDLHHKVLGLIQVPITGTRERGCWVETGGTRLHERKVICTTFTALVMELLLQAGVGAGAVQ